MVYVLFSVSLSPSLSMSFYLPSIRLTVYRASVIMFMIRAHIFSLSVVFRAKLRNLFFLRKNFDIAAEFHEILQNLRNDR